MTKTEEALCNGILFSVPRLVPTSVQEGELDNAMYYAIVYLAAQQDKVVVKFYEAPSYTPLKWNDEEIECATFSLEVLDDSEIDGYPTGYKFGDNDGDGVVYPADAWLSANPGKSYNGLMLYPGLKCIIVNSIKEIIRNNNTETHE